ncbi:hypothetical protein CPB86DRAFT_870907 [Serendipita vermifera]|nr:hypothetical protein CPB86DRAFT_870907 [Serendipita vermifera]
MEKEPSNSTPSSTRGKNQTEYQWEIGWKLPSMLFGPLLAALAIAIGHDQFLISLHGKTLGTSRRQLVIRGSNNGLATIASHLLNVALGTALVEITWELIRRSSLSIRHLNALFDLPSPLSILATPSVVKRASHLIVIVTLIHSLNVISIFVPAALSIQEGNPLWLDAIDISTSPYRDQGYNSYYTGPADYFYQQLRRSLQNRGVSNVTRPENCGQTCQYSFYFQAPAIQCTTIYNDEWINPEIDIPSLTFPTIYRATSNVSNSTHLPCPGTPLGMNFTWLNITTEDDLSLAQMGDLPPTTISCYFYRARYTANVTWTDQGRELKAEASRYSSYPLYNHALPPHVNSSHAIYCTPDDFTHCNMISFLDGFTSLLQGEAFALATDRNNYTISSQPEQVKSTLDSFFLNYTDSGSMSFYMPSVIKTNDSIFIEHWWPTYPQTLLSYALEVFLDFSEFQISTSLQATATYQHSPIYLWAFYGSAIGACSIVSTIAMALLYAHGAPSSKGFSHLLVMTRNPGLHRIVQDAPLGAHQLTDKAQDINLTFGKLGKRYENETEMVGFGVEKEDTVSPLTKPQAVELWEE